MKILIVEDELSLTKALEKGLRRLGYAIDCAYNGEEALELYYGCEYDIIVLDINLPKLDGFQLLKEIRSENQDINVLILSARADIEDKINGLDLGANDYLAKPFHFAELEARIRALLRRDFRTKDSIIVRHGVKVDTAKKKVCVDGDTITLSKKEYAILEYLMINSGRIISGEELIDHVWASDVDAFTSSFKVHIHALRKWLPDGFIKNMRGEGYYVE